MKRFFIQLLTSYLIIIILVSTLLFVSSLNAFKASYIESSREYLLDTARSIGGTVQGYLLRDNIEGLQDYVSRFKNKSGNRLTIVRIDGEVIADSDEDPRQMDNHRNRPEILQAIGRGTGSAIRYSKTVRTDLLYTALRIQNDDSPGGIIRISRYLAEIQSYTRRLRNRILRINLILILLFVPIALFFSRRFSRPVSELIRASRKISTGDFATRVYLEKSQGELKLLADNFNSMTDHLHQLFTESTKQRQWLKEIIDSMNELLVVLDGENRIILHNRSFENRYREGRNRIDREPFWKILPDKGFEKFVQDSREKQRNLSRELIIENLFYICSSSYIPEKDEIIVVFHDITESRNLKIIKKDFVSNVSHEIKTPLTSIKGFVDTLIEEEADPKKLEFLGIIKKNTDRLNNIVKDLLILSELEKEDTRLNLSTLNVTKLVGDVIQIFKKDIEKKNLTLRILSDENEILIRGDRFKLEQVFINLIDNAVKYTEKGGITVTLERDQKGVHICIEDTGIGISSKHQQRIFERFFVVDQSRSRRSGGTGLGLSIVKHIVLQHNGRITVSSVLNEGTRFDIYLP